MINAIMFSIGLYFSAWIISWIYFALNATLIGKFIFPLSTFIVFVIFVMNAGVDISGDYHFAWSGTAFSIMLIITLFRRYKKCKSTS